MLFLNCTLFYIQRIYSWRFSFNKVTFVIWLKCHIEVWLPVFLTKITFHCKAKEMLKLKFSLKKKGGGDWPFCKHNQMKCLKAWNPADQLQHFFLGRNAEELMFSYYELSKSCLPWLLCLDRKGCSSTLLVWQQQGEIENCWPEEFQQSRMNIPKTAAHSKSICAGADSSSHFLRSLTVFFRVHLQLKRFKITDFVLTINVKDQLHYIKPFKTSQKLITKTWV